MAEIGSGHYGMPGGIRRPIIDKAWYEKAADIIGSSASTDERLAVLNEIWEAYLLDTNEHFHPRKCVIAEINVSDEMFTQGMDNALQQTTGLSLEQIVNYAKEIMKNGTQETETATPSTEQLG